MKKILIALVCTISINIYAQNADTVSVMYYNILNYPGTTPERVELFRKIMSYAQPDILVVNELSSDGGADNLLNNGLNVNGVSHYERADFIDGPDTDNMLFYNSNLFSLHSQDTIQTALRLINRYELFYTASAATGDTIFLNFFSAHLKASTGSSNEQLRLEEVMEFTDYINNQGSIENVCFGGDFNFYAADEPAYQHLINNSPVLISDPLGETWPSDWHNNIDYTLIHTQSTRNRQFGGGAYGGLDDRFDFIMMTDDILNNLNNASYLQDTYISFGNDGNHFNDSINAIPNTAVPDSISDALHYMSDHLPVMADIRLSFGDPVQSLTITKPTFQEVFISGNTNLIEWTSQNIETVDISYRLFNESEFTLIESDIEAQLGSYSWNTPFINDDSAFIKIESSMDQEIADTSKLFYLVDDIGNQNLFKNHNFNAKLTPNPTKGKFTVELTSIEDTWRIEIRDVYGDIVSHENKISYVNRFDLSSVKKGMYFVLVFNNNGLEIGKILRY